MASSLAHEAILTQARRLEAAASDGDRDRVVSALRRLIDALIDHIEAEHDAIDRVPADTARKVVSGQQRLMNELREVETELSDRRRCDVLAQQFTAELGLQAGYERRIAASFGPPRGRGDFEEPIDIESANDAEVLRQALLSLSSRSDGS